MSGKVYLVGAGPGDPDLLTVKARRVIDTADVIMYDALTGEDIVESLPQGTTVYDVGKRPGDDGHRTTQDEINQKMVAHARDGDTVVRLKSGDPTVFGRGGEEAEHLADELVRFEIVPGVSSMLAAPGVVGIPLTHRRLASAITVITGHQDPTKEESALEWSSIADTVTAGGTLLILMGVSKLSQNVDRLREQGVPADTPIAMVEKATWSDEAMVTGTLESIVADADAAGIAPPAVTIVGDVVSVRDQVADQLLRDRESSIAATGTAHPTTAPDGTVLPRSPVLENS